jgi:hypothetical protein
MFAKIKGRLSALIINSQSKSLCFFNVILVKDELCLHLQLVDTNRFGFLTGREDEQASGGA